MQIQQQIAAERSRLFQKKEELEKRLRTLPEGILKVYVSGGKRKCFQEVSGKRQFIPKARQDFIEQLFQKTYLSCQISDLSNTLSALSAFEKQIHRNAGAADALIQRNIGYNQLYSSTFGKQEAELSEWEAIQYDPNPQHPERLIFRTSKGHFVRSKSELIIANSLFSHNIPYRYEFPLTLGSVTLYPDFYILSPKDKSLFIWEHFGRMNDPAYSRTVLTKLQTYLTYGYIPTINLIITCDAENGSIDSRYIELLIDYYFSD